MKYIKEIITIDEINNLLQLFSKAQQNDIIIIGIYYQNMKHLLNYLNKVFQKL